MIKNFEALLFAGAALVELSACGSINHSAQQNVNTSPQITMEMPQKQTTEKNFQSASTSENRVCIGTKFSILLPSLEGISQACTQAIQKCQKVAGTEESKTIIDQYNQCKAEADELGRSDEILQCPEDPSQLQGSCKKLVMKFLLKKVECDTKAETQPVQDFNQCTDQVGNVCPNAILESAHCSDKH